MPEQICFLKDISKSYDAQTVVSNINLGLYRGEIHAVIGDNGVGKSTLMRILAGYITPDSGEIVLNGVRVAPYNQYGAKKHGISYIAPDSVCVPEMTVLENVFLEDYPIRARSRTLDHEEAARRAASAFDTLGFGVDLHRKLGTLGTAERKIVQLASILCHEPAILVLDEVALGLTEHETKGFYDELLALKRQGVSIFLVTQDLKKVFEVADQITMIANGNVVWSQRNTKAFFDEICKKISITIDKRSFPKLPPRIGEVVLEIEDMGNATALSGVNFSLHKGEILGILGIAGSGRTSLARCIFGLDKTRTGAVALFGKSSAIRAPIDAVNARLGFMEELPDAGLVQEMNCIENITLANVKGVSSGQIIDLALERSSAMFYLERLRIDREKWQQPVKFLSRGEQQKVLLSKWLFTNAKILFLDEPTLGMDIATRVEAYNLISGLALKGMSFVIISSDVSELVGMCDRVYLMEDGTLTREFIGEEVTVEHLVKALSH